MTRGAYWPKGGHGPRGPPLGYAPVYTDAFVKCILRIDPWWVIFLDAIAQMLETNAK